MYTIIVFKVICTVLQLQYITQNLFLTTNIYNCMEMETYWCAEKIEIWLGDDANEYK